jgi:hypothetical protein
MNLNHAGCGRNGRLNPGWANFDSLPATASVKHGPETKGQPMMKSHLNAGEISAPVWNLPVRTANRKLRLPLPAPSVRVPATRENRERLRRLRAQELAAWKTTNPHTALRAEPHSALAAQRSESRLFGIVAALAAAGLTIGLAAALDFVAHWNQFASLIRALLG